MKHFTHHDPTFTISYNGWTASLSHCIVCREELDHNDSGQIYAHYHCWGSLESEKQGELKYDLGPRLRLGRKGDTIDFTL